MFNSCAQVRKRTPTAAHVTSSSVTLVWSQGQRGQRFSATVTTHCNIRPMYRTKKHFYIKAIAKKFLLGPSFLHGGKTVE